jgi:hypothetical protein
MVMIKKVVVATALLLLAATGESSTSAYAEGALAVGMPNGDPKNGFKWSIMINTPGAGSEAMKSCHAARSERTAAACQLIRTFQDQCVAVAVNGDPDPAPASAAGWAIAPDSVAAIDRALAQCEAMRKRRGRPCVLDGGRDRALKCDGKAK